MKKNASVFRKVLCAAVFMLTSVFSAQASSQLANRRTAVRCLELAKDYAAYKNWNAVISQAELGISYDDTVADLWYYEALAKYFLGERKADVLRYVSHSLGGDTWVDYNRDNARILYADLLSDTVECEKAMEVLDQTPVLFSADAEYIRAKCCYRLSKTNPDEYLEKARNKIETSRKMFPTDTRFPLLFFMNENPADENETVKNLASAFILRIKQYASPLPDKETELEIYAARYAAKDVKEKMLKSFNARHLRHPLYAVEGIGVGLLTEEAAVKYISSFCDSQIDYDILCEFAGLLKDEKQIEVFGKYLNSFNGVIAQDTNQDGIVNLYVKYSRGRPANIIYDSNQDDVTDFNMVLDFGEPLHADFESKKLSVYWDPYPYVKRVEFTGVSNVPSVIFNMVDETLNWVPLKVVKDEKLSVVSEDGVYYPQLDSSAGELTNAMMVNACSSYVLPTKERKNASVEYVVLDGRTQIGYYRINDRLYAQAEFNNGVPSLRIVDADDDGVFETTEVFGQDKDNVMSVHSLDDEYAVLTKIFGMPERGGFYLSQIQIDNNHDTVPEFIEENKAYGETVTSWDNDSDGLWDVRYVRYARRADETGTIDPLIEDAMFYVGRQTDLITVTSIDDVPVRVKSSSEDFDVVKDSMLNLYWIGKTGSSDSGKKVLEKLNLTGGQGVCNVVEYDGQQILCVRVAGKSYAHVLVPQEYQEVEKQRQIEARKKADAR